MTEEKSSKRAVLEMVLISAYDLIYFVGNIVFWVFIFVATIDWLKYIGAGNEALVTFFGFIWVLSRIGVLREYKWMKYSVINKFKAE